MPFQSEKQRRFMYAKHPAIAKRWAAEYGSKPVNKDPHKHVREALKAKRGGY